MAIKRYYRLFLAFVKQNTSREMQYRSNWILVNLNTLAWSVMRIIYYVLAFGAVAKVGDWDYAHSLILAGVFMLVHGTHKTFFEGNLRRLVAQIYTGELDHILTKPVASQFMCSLRIVIPRAIIRIVLGVAILIYGLSKTTTPPPMSGILSLIIMSISSVLIMYAFSFIITTTAFWLGYIEPLADLPLVLTSMTYMPYDIFGPFGNTILTWVLPLMFITTLPAKALFNPQPLAVLSSILVAATLLLISHLVWQRGLQSYSSASS